MQAISNSQAQHVLVKRCCREAQDGGSAGAAGEENPSSTNAGDDKDKANCIQTSSSVCHCINQKKGAANEGARIQEESSTNEGPGIQKGGDAQSSNRNQKKGSTNESSGIQEGGDAQSSSCNQEKGSTNEGSGIQEGGDAQSSSRIQEKGSTNEGSEKGSTNESPGIQKGGNAPSSSCNRTGECQPA